MIADDPTIADGHVIADAAAARSFMLAGNAILTLRSHRTGAHYTYQVRRAGEGKTLWFVSLLTAPEVFTYLGIIREAAQGLRFATTAKSCQSGDSPAAVGFERMFRALSAHGTILAGLDFMHAGKCGRCARRLTHPESIESGFGDECLSKIGGGR
jgi:hypothetical protein